MEAAPAALLEVQVLMGWYERHVDQANQWTRVADIAFKQGDEDLGLQARDNARAYDRLAHEALDRMKLDSRVSNPGPRG